MKKNIIISILSIVLVIMSFVTYSALTNLGRKMSLEEYTYEVLCDKFNERFDAYNEYMELDATRKVIEKEECNGYIYYDMIVFTPTCDEDGILISTDKISMDEIKVMYADYISQE